MSFDDVMMVCMLGLGLAVFYAGLYKFGAFYHAHQLTKTKEEFKEGLHKPHYFGDGQ